MSVDKCSTQNATWMLERLEGMRLAYNVARAGGALTNPFHVGTARYAGFQNVASLHHYQRMADFGGLHQHPTFNVPQGV